MLSPAVHADRRARLRALLPSPILLMGTGTRARNLPMNTLPFRQDSSFLYFTGCTLPGAALLLADGQETLFLPPYADDDALWHGFATTIEAEGARLGFDAVRTPGELDAMCAAHQGALHSIPISDLAQTQLAACLTGLELRYGQAHGSLPLVQAIIHLRRQLSPIEVVEMRAAAAVTTRAHLAAMAATRPGRHERDIATLFDAVIASAGMANAYQSIVTVRGEVLHNHDTVHRLEAGQLLLLDGAAETATGYSTDVTRTWPVSGRFDGRQRAAYDAVLEAQLAAIAAVGPGVRYRHVHDTASRILARFLRDEGLLTCDPDAAVESGAHALFFPHGVGHLIGMDVHDLESFGDLPAYPPGRSRSPQFGTCYLRLDLDLEPGIAVTIEPGFYVVPAILADPELTGRFAGQIDLGVAAKWAGFGGIRIEDDVLCTADGREVLTPDIPKTAAAVEAVVGTMGALTLPEQVN